MDFNGKVALITGSSSGIGEAIAIKLWSLGANVVITGRDDKRIAQVVDKCQTRDNQRALGVRADLLVDKDIEELVAKTIKEFGKINILVNNSTAGGFAIVPFGEPGYLNMYDMQMNGELRAIQVVTQLALPHLELTKGNIVNISSIGSIVPNIENPPFCMAKSGLDMFTKCMAIYLGPKGVRVNSVNPSATKTPVFERRTGSTKLLESLVTHCRETYPLGRIGEPQDMAEAVAFLASERSASFITGLIMPVDGGALLVA
ncbi:unnamed protein product [Medioppia subpectinata]|uniref:Uncharacterized protein n=1 Tax=Medioppia subpectinata TaxID=1979941 RepID=A0A7R9PWW4_9ACAR|nr:unnamed protein product [Medioppia subpectinata]CAG2103741.1 unnamed protein product [Medioppia subpectinata]